MAAVAFSVSVESRSAGWLWKTQPSVSPNKVEPAKSSSSSVAVKPLATKPTLAPFAPTVTASKTDTLLIDVDIDGKADPGDTLKYSVVISATGEDATGVTFTDTVDPNTTFANTLRTTPLARNDSYTATGNVRIQVPVGSGVLANDADPDGVGAAISVTAGTFASAQGGNVTMNADGSFSYNPPAGFEGSDSFTYTLNDNEAEGNNTDTGTVSITVSGMIWFINNAASCPCDGRLTNPFNTLAAFQAVNNGTGNHPAANDNIFVYESATDYVGPVTLLNGQKFIGQDATASLATIAGITLAPFSDSLPTTTPGAPIVNITSASAGIILGQNNTLRGFTGGNAAPDISGTSFGTATISDVTLNGNGQALNLSTGNLNATFGSISSTNSASTGISLSSVASGSLSTGSTTISNPGGIGISVSSSGLTLGFANTSVSSSGGTGVSLTSNTGGITFGSLDISPDAGQRGLLATENTGTITTTSGTITTGIGTAVEITKGSPSTPLAMVLTTVTSSGAPNGIKLVNTSGSFTVNGTGSANSGGIITESTASASTADPNGKAVFLSGASNVTLRFMKISVTVGSASGIIATNISGTNSLEKSVVDFNNTTPGGAAVVYGLRVENTNTNATVNVDATAFQNKLDGVTAVSYSINGNSQVTVNVTDNNTADAFDSKYTGLFPSGIVMGCGDDAGSTAKCFFNVSNTDFLNAPSNGINDLEMTVQQNATLVPNISNNTFDKVGLPLATVGVINVNTTGSGRLGDASNNALFSGNTITNIQSGAGPTFAYTLGGNNGYLGMRIAVDGNSGVNDKIKILNNDIRLLARQGILISSRGNRNDVNVVVQGNTVGTVAQPVATSNRRGIEVETQNAASLKIQVLNNPSIVGSGTSNSNSSLQFRAGTDNTSGAANGTIFATVTGNTIANTGAGNVGRFRAETINLGVNVNAANICLDLTNNTLDSALKQFDLVHNSTGTFSFHNGGGNVGTVTTTGTITNIGTGCTTPTVLSSVVAQSLSTESLKSTDLSSDAVKDAPQQAQDRNTLQALGGERPEQANTPKLTEAELQAAVLAAIERWREAGLSTSELMRLQRFTFEVADLPDDQLASAAGTVVRIDETAAGYGWYADVTPLEDSEFGVLVPDKERQATELSPAFGRMDLLTVVMRELRVLARGKFASEGPQAWLTQGTLATGTRRAPEFKLPDVAKMSAPKQGSSIAQNAEKRNQNYQEVASVKASRNGRVLRNHAMRPAMTVADVMLNIGVIPAGKSITITFNAQVNDPFPGPGNQVCNQGSVSGTNFTTVLTDDPDVGGATDPTCTLIDLQADVEITAKSDTPDPVIAGNNITYTINLINHGPNPGNVTVTDATPAGTTFVSAQVTSGTGWTPSTPSVGGTGNVTFTKNAVAKDETATFEIVVKVNSSVAGGSTITNTATAAVTGATDPVPGNNSKTATTAVIAQADLSITKTDGATTEIPGTSVSYTITVNNAGPSDANGVSVSDTFPGILTGVTFTSVAAGGATGNTAAGAGNISDTVNMPAGSSITYTVSATIQSSATGTLDNTATVTAPGGVTDPNTANNSATDSDTLVPTADLSITKTDGATSEVPGTSVTYTITVTNSGPSDAPNTSVADTFPGILTGVTFTSVAAGGATGNTAAGSGNISDTLSMPAGSSVTYTVNATIQAAATGNLTNTATVTEDGTVTDPNQANNSSTDTDTLTPEADLSITKTDGATDEVPGTSVTYTITVTNNGPSDAPGTSVTDTFPGILSGVTFTSVAAGGATGNTAAGSGNINDTVSMPTGSSVTYTVTANIASSATGNLSNTATVTAGGGVTDPTPGNNSATDTDTLTPSADVVVDKAGQATVTPGDNISYTITVSNIGPSDAVNLSFTDAVPTGTTFVSVTTPAGWTRTDAVPVGGTGNITFTATSLAAGAPASVFTLVVKANLGLADATIITNTVSVTSATADPAPGNNSDSVNTTVQNNADLAITKQVAPTGPNGAGASVTYTIDVINNGPSPATSVTFTDVVPAGLVVNTQNNPSGWSCNSVVGSNGTITCTKSGMASGETAQLVVVATINCGQANGSTIMNTATVSAASPADGDLSNNTAQASFTVNNPAPVITASIDISQLPQNTHELINVGLHATATDGPCGTPTITVQVFGDEDDETPTRRNEVFSPDAKDIAPETLRLRAERVDTGDGRIYLVVVKATDAAGQTSFQTFTVFVPKSSSPASIASAQAQAAAAKAFADANNGAAPAGFFVIGDGQVIGNKQ